MKPLKYKDLTWQERRQVRLDYLKEQDGKCFFCGGDLGTDPPKHITEMKIDWTKFPSGFLDYPVHLQHCHQTGLTEGVVHAYCNAVMWQYHGR